MSMFAGKSKNNKILVGILIFVIASLLVAGVLFAYYAVSAATTNIYKGVKIGSIDIGGMSEKAAEEFISSKYAVEYEKYTLNCNGTVFDVYSSAVSLKPDYKLTAAKAASCGKEGSMLNKIKNMRNISKNNKFISLEITCDIDALQYIINEKMGESLEAVQEHSIEIGDGEIIISNGNPGRIVPATEVIELIAEKITNGKAEEIINVEIKDKYPEKIDFDKFYKEYNRKAENARIEENGDEIIIVPEIVGIELDREIAKKIIEENINSTQKYSIPANINYPEITSKDLEEEFVDTLIATYQTNYSTSTANRKENIRLASEKLNGFVLNPGEVFSFNTVVGPRTAERGYKVAQGYMGTKVVDDIGGGICQVSSTLYNAVVLADMEIIFRTNHTMPVSYTPLGRDATVSYGAVDFKFKNNKETPVKFEFISDGSNLTVNVYGRKKYIKDISIESEITGYIPFSVTEIQDDTMYEGETVVESAGANGTSVKTYKVVKENGVVVSRTPLANSSYIPTSRVVRIGTMPKEDSSVPSDAAPDLAENTADSSANTEQQDLDSGDNDTALEQGNSDLTDATVNGQTEDVITDNSETDGQTDGTGNNMTPDTYSDTNEQTESVNYADVATQPAATPSDLAETTYQILSDGI